ncbi:hypothetical protein NT05HA_0420 [Aggregatibacter aphrophilus NJ8700]|nr:hypothetical protein NT05HA_0420 [Aggregatibacter aphrophilus NJ8700]
MHPDCFLKDGNPFIHIVPTIKSAVFFQIVFVLNAFDIDHTLS